MAFFKKIFSKKDPLVVIENAYRQQAWAVVVSSAAELSPETLDRNPTVSAMVDEARKNLAEMNLEEAAARFAQGDIQAGREHLDLARQYGAGGEAVQAVSTQNLDESADMESSSATAPAHATCTDCADEPTVLEQAQQTDDWDLLLAGLPEDQAAAYRAKSDVFRQALQAAYAGQDEEACVLFADLPAEERDASVCYEQGVALARLGHFDEALTLLYEVLDEMPDHRLALDALMDIHLAGHPVDGLDERLAGIPESDRNAGFIAACRARLAWKEGRGPEVVECGEKALAAGEGSPDIVEMLAFIYEQQHQYDRAEQTLGLLSSAGCGGGVHSLLAEFWLRRGTHLDQALESFKSSARREPDNPRWVLRIGQVYLARGWRKDGIKLLNQLATAEGLSEELREEIHRSLEKT
ncbi:hypothetical protein C2E25_16015 [Geothermobacter hydrogeniphilus]|uniref:Tetratricopeptide repeat-containing protein n=1 Tax=Geothermobacter hydrogeniphilus TaxID=1969733 RepID=A0A2K2H606_9BACT|nr:hypothetical protein [Geothermobacter hydrogeniphilus]PNU18756.1 hypothetical protein C2E25_16015 [Geothermobacter hydrogeniphilus]